MINVKELNGDFTKSTSIKNIFRKVFLNEFFILFLIILNSIVIFVSGFDLGVYYNYILSIIDNAITVLFLVELFIKLREYGKSYFKSSWNQFDFLLILLSIPTLFAFLFELETSDFSYLLVFRVMRVFKSFRFLKFIPGIDHLIRGVNRALKASIIVLIGFIVYIFIIGIFSFYLFKETAPEYYKDPLISLYSTFKIFTIEGWFEIPEKVVAGLNMIPAFFTFLFFIFIVLSGGIFGLSIVNSIFVDAMVSDNNDELEKKIDNLEDKINQLLEENRNIKK